MRSLPAALLLSAATALATEDRPSPAAGRRALATVDHALVRQPKNLGIINNRFDSMANSAHQAVSKLAAHPDSNDDPEIQKLLLELLSVTINGTVLTRSPTTPSTLTSPAGSAPLAPSAASPAPAPPEAATGASEPNAIATGTDGSEGTPPNDAGSSPADAFVPSPIPMDDQDDTGPRTTTSSTLIVPGSISVSSTKATATASTTAVDDAETGDDETYSPTALVPTYSPSIFSKAPSAPTFANSQQGIDGGAVDGGCPPEFDEIKQYQEGDRVSLKRNRRCRTGRCHLIYQCKPWPESAYCSLVPPRTSDKGWLMVGRCADNEVPADAVGDGANAVSSGAAGGSEHEGALAENSTATQSNAAHEDATNELAAENATLSSNATSHVPSQSNASGIHEDGKEGHRPSASSPTTMLPTPSPTPKQQFAYSPTWAKPSTSDLGISTDVDPATSILVNLPRIICDITLSSSLSQSFESNRVLIAAMTHMIYTMFDQHLPKSLYELTGISLSVEVKNNGSEATESPTVRIHAFFSGVASFSLQGAPSANDLITLLIRYFDVDAFNLLLRQGPLKAARLRTAKSQVDEIKVNSVFFTLEDGSLVLAGSTYEENKLPAPTKAIVPSEQKESRAEITLVVLALIGMACVLALMAFLLYSNKMKGNEDEDNVALASTDDLPASDAQSRIAQGAPGSVEIEVPSTPQFAVSDISDDDMHSRVSTLSESPFPTKSPPFWSHPGLGQPAVATPTNLVGATNPSSYCHVGDGALEETWQQHQSTKWELYKDSSSMGSL